MELKKKKINKCKIQGDHKPGNSEFTQQDGKRLVSDKREIAITCEFCHDLHLTLRVFWS